MGSSPESWACPRAPLGERGGRGSSAGGGVSGADWSGSGGGSGAGSAPEEGDGGGLGPEGAEADGGIWPAGRTVNMLLHLAQRTLTPLHLTFSSGIRYLVWQCSH